MGKLTKKKASDVQIARGRLKGALMTAVKSDDEDTSDSAPRGSRSRGRPSKKNTTSNSPQPLTPQSQTSTSEAPLNSTVHENFVMKLFDRSLDLAKYDEHTPLYPICRAWLMNQPRSNQIKSYRNRRTPSPPVREKNEDLLEKVLNDSTFEVTSLPAPKQLDIPRVPSPLPEQKNKDKKNLDNSLDHKSPLKSKEELLESHKQRWVKVRSKWNAHSKRCDEKYSLSYEILENLYKPDS